MKPQSQSSDDLNSREINAFRDRLKQAGGVNEILLKDPGIWTQSEVKAVMNARKDARNQPDIAKQLFAAEKQWFDQTYGTDPAKRDATGRLATVAPRRPVPDQATAVTAPDGQPLAQAIDRTAEGLYPIANQAGPKGAIKALQSGINLLAKGDLVKDTGPALKVDGDGGPKTQAATRLAAAKLGPSKLQEAQALGHVRELALEARRSGHANNLGEKLAMSVGHLFRSDPTAEINSAERVEAQTFQDTLNQQGRKRFGPQWIDLNADGWIGPKTGIAFTKLSKSEDPDDLAQELGRRFGLFA